MTWYKTVTYRKIWVCANNTTELGKSFLTTALNDLSRSNQIDITGPNSVVLFAQTLICSLCNYHIDDISTDLKSYGIKSLDTIDIIHL